MIPAPPSKPPFTWWVGENLLPEAERLDEEGELEVRMTFRDADKETVREWMRWLMAIDPDWQTKGGRDAV